MKMETTIGFLRTGDFFWFEGIKYKVGHLIENTNGYVACVDTVSRKVKRFYIETIVEIKPKELSDTWKQQTMSRFERVE